MSILVNEYDAKIRFSELLQRVLNGEDVVIANAGIPLARLVVFQNKDSRRVPGRDAGAITITPDFDAPLPEFDGL